ncbi:Transmembrane transcriptional regulator (anti-sigma factor RsiW) [Tistlia consotensis]|uniref:Transmembrane transcriptional regulator (Anti-sigma factor RsiW) n=1 Tax=Tistlia consotensis USBA 355 TaxID=560819 RepID=A0A1Y6BQU7_9PROT|nr:anti-sigma factor [Tistlia consotensis]SMF14769.1 Transmembrane transcriptional regulator (anti-sigma factor RsiW) [Tistlia consotensis USBA 355]SNR49252.1 Transmembrane transcriptional regulator (anti-sigma factor RsiW) [Tistlia consotensis]
MTDRPALEDATLHAYLDGELAPAQAAEVAARLEQDAGARARLAGWQEDRRRLKAALDPVLAEPLAPRLAAAAWSAPRGRRRAAALLARVAAALLLVAAFGAGWLVRDAALSPAQVTAFGRAALDAHRVFAAELRHPVEVPASQAGHLNAWLSNRIGVPIAAPDLSSAGYRLLGGRLLSEPGRPVALYMYEDAAGRRLTLSLAHSRAGDGTGDLTFQARGRLQVVSWMAGPLDVALAGELDGDRLRGLAELVAAGLGRHA